MVIVTLTSAATALRAFCFNYSGQRVVARLRQDVHRAIIRQEVDFFDATRTGDLMSRLASDTEVIQDAATTNISMLIRYCVQIIGSLTIMLALSWKLTLVMLSVVPAIAMGAVRYGKKIKEIRKDFQDALASSSTNAEEAISNIRTVRAFCAEEEMHQQYAEAVRKSLMVGRKMTIAGSVRVQHTAACRNTVQHSSMCCTAMQRRCNAAAAPHARRSSRPSCSSSRSRQ
jgi:ABC-type multidrug transport system fused ATPase/permease subunit